MWHAPDSVAVLAEIPLRSPRKICIFTIKKYIYRIEVSGKKNVLILKKTSLAPEQGACNLLFQINHQISYGDTAWLQRLGKVPHIIRKNGYGIVVSQTFI